MAGVRESFFLCLGQGWNACIFSLPLTYHEGMILTLFYTCRWHRAIFFYGVTVYRILKSYMSRRYSPI